MPPTSVPVIVVSLVTLTFVTVAVTVHVERLPGSVHVRISTRGARSVGRKPLPVRVNVLSIPRANLRARAARNVALRRDCRDDRRIHDAQLARDVARIAVRINDLELIIPRKNGRIGIDHRFHRARIDELNVGNFCFRVPLDQVNTRQLHRLLVAERIDGKWRKRAIR